MRETGAGQDKIDGRQYLALGTQRTFLIRRSPGNTAGCEIEKYAAQFFTSPHRTIAPDQTNGAATPSQFASVANRLPSYKTPCRAALTGKVTTFSPLPVPRTAESWMNVSTRKLSSPPSNGHYAMSRLGFQDQIAIFYIIFIAFQYDGQNWGDKRWIVEWSPNDNHRLNMVNLRRNSFRLGCKGSMVNSTQLQKEGNSGPIIKNAEYFFVH